MDKEANNNEKSLLHGHNNLFYKNEEFNYYGNLNLKSILSPEVLIKLSSKDWENLAKFLPNDPRAQKNPREYILSVLKPDFKSRLVNPIENFQRMMSNGFFTKKYQDNLEIYKIDSLEDYIGLHEKIYRKIKKNKSKYTRLLTKMEYEGNESEKNSSDFHDEESSHELSMHSELASSGYSTLMIESEPEDVVEQPKQIIQKEEIHDSFVKEDKNKSVKVSRNQITQKQRTIDEVKEFQRQELERYKTPHLPYIYSSLSGIKSIVAPILKKQPSSQNNKPREHVMLKQDRPYFITILCLARDAAARLVEGMGTRADICDLIKDSQYISENLTDSQINNVVSGALDRLHYEKDPCIKYDSKRKMWIYLHRERTLEYWTKKEYLLLNKDSHKEDGSKLNPSLKLLKESILLKLSNVGGENIRGSSDDEEINDLSGDHDDEFGRSDSGQDEKSTLLKQKRKNPKSNQ